MLTSAAGVDALLEHVEVLALGNLDPVHPLRDPERLRRHQRAPTRPTTRRCSTARGPGIEALNLKFGADHADRFFLFHRDRQWNVGEHAWIGWERKRGKIEEFNRLLRGATDTSFSTQVGALDVLPLGPLLHHARLGHASAARRGQAPHRHHRAPAEPAARSTRGSDASPRATASCSRASA